MTFTNNLFTNEIFKVYLRNGKNSIIRLYRFSDKDSLLFDIQAGNKVWYTTKENALKYYSDVKRYNIGVDLKVGTYIYISDRNGEELNIICKNITKNITILLPNYAKSLDSFAKTFSYTHNCIVEYYSYLVGVLIKFGLFPSDICCTIICNKKINFTLNNKNIEYIIHNISNTNIITNDLL
jgi:hypothetical protein